MQCHFSWPGLHFEVDLNHIPVHDSPQREVPHGTILSVCTKCWDLSVGSGDARLGTLVLIASCPITRYQWQRLMADLSGALSSRGRHSQHAHAQWGAVHIRPAFSRHGASPYKEPRFTAHGSFFTGNGAGGGVG